MPTINEYRIELARLVQKCSKDWAVHQSHLASAQRLLAEPLTQPEPGSGPRFTSVDIDNGKPVAYVREADQYGAKVMHPDCDTSRAVTAELGKKLVTWQTIGVLKACGFEVRTRGADGRTL